MKGFAAASWFCYVARIDADGGDGRVSRRESRGGVDAAALVSNSFIDGYTRRKRTRGRGWLGLGCFWLRLLALAFLCPIPGGL